MDKIEQGQTARFHDSLAEEKAESGGSARLPSTPVVVDEIADLNQLVRQLNQPEPSVDAVGLSMREGLSLEQKKLRRRPSAPRSFQICDDLQNLLHGAVARGASDLHLVAGSPPYFRVDGELRSVGTEQVTQATMCSWFEERMTESQRHALGLAGAVDFSARLSPLSEGNTGAFSRVHSSGGRFRINVHRQRGLFAASLRMLPSAVPSLETLGLPEALCDLVRPMQGVVLICGPTGAGKSSTLAALVDWINRERRAHVLTLEDPIEFEHKNHKSLVQQMEVGTDISSFGEGLRAALRQDPDVILLGEMRDLESIATALAAAETGHLLLSTVHTSDPAQAIHRVVDVFPAEAREQMRQLLAVGLEAIVCQKLLPRIGGGRVPALEILKATSAVRHHIRSGALHKLYNEMVTGRRVGMVTMEASLAKLVGAGVVSREVALARTSRPEEFESVLRHHAGP